MKNILCFLLCSVILTAATAQDPTSFGAISNEELALKECPFDKEAGAMVLLDEAESNYDEENHLITNRHIRIKILKEKSFDAADITIYYFRKDDFESVYNLAAQITNVDATGQVTTEKLPAKAFFKKNENERLGKMIFTFPGVKVGSIIEYKYQSFMKHYGGLRDWYFQQYLPVAKSQYKLHIAPHLEFTYKVVKSDDMPVEVKPEPQQATVYFEMNNVPGLDDEPYMDAREDYIQKVTFQLSGYNRGDGAGKKNYMTTWDEVTKELLADDDFGAQLHKNIPGTKDFIEGIKNLPEMERMKAVHNYVRSSMRWNGTYGIYAREGVKTPWDKHEGRSSDINLILNNLLHEADLEVYPVLVSERFNGKVDTKYPFIDQFNNVFACVVIKGKKYFLDATDRATPAHIIPKDILNTTAFIVNKKNGGLVTINNEELLYSEYINTQMSVDNSGKISGEALVKSDGYARMEKIAAVKEMGDEKFISHYYKRDDIGITNFEFLNKDNDSLSADQQFKFTSLLPQSGDYIYVPLNNFFGFDKNPFLSTTRFSNVNFGYKRRINTYTAITLPPGYAVDVMPKGVKMTTPDNDIVISRAVDFDKENNSVVCLYLIDFKKSLYTADEYSILQQVYKKLFELLKEPLVLKKK